MKPCMMTSCHLPTVCSLWKAMLVLKTLHHFCGSVPDLMEDRVIWRPSPLPLGLSTDRVPEFNLAAIIYQRSKGAVDTKTRSLTLDSVSAGYIRCSAHNYRGSFHCSWTRTSSRSNAAVLLVKAQRWGQFLKKEDHVVSVCAVLVTICLSPP